MHIPDNYLSPQTDAVMAVAMVPVWVHCIKKVRATLDREHMAFLGICAAFSFLLMMFNVPLPGGTTGHAVGGALIALLLGPEAAAIAVSVALALQALLFGDGGVLSFGANCFNMAFVLPFAAAIVFRALNSRLHDKSWGTSVSAIVSGWVGLCLAALCAAVEFGIQPMLFTNASGAPLYCPFPLSIAIPMIPHMLVAGVVEGVATAAIYGFIKKTAPSVIVGPEAADGQLAAEGAAAKKTSLVPMLILVAVLVAATPLGLLATGDAWGEWDAERRDRRSGGWRRQPAGFSRPRYPDLCRCAAHGRLSAGLFRGTRSWLCRPGCDVYSFGCDWRGGAHHRIPPGLADGQGKRCSWQEPSCLAGLRSSSVTSPRGLGIV